ncbi:MAG TPA: hydrogenase [Ruminococcaceae bacterium]|jgi:formate hydrogenlyase subunit 6/NADH:ubiquinone oxidoreductase subunit I|nr:hydrogenase [Oscillospiraceae bacterium]
MSIMNFTKTVVKNLFSKPATRMYPQQPRNYPARTRGHIEIDIDSCIFCGMCSRKCPTGAITVTRPQRTWSIKRFSCIQCGYCVESCPKKCLSMHQTYTEPDGVKRTDTFAGPPQAAKPAAPKAGVPAAPKTEAPAAPKVETPAAQKTETPTAPKSEASAAPKVEMPVAQKAETPAAPKAEASAGVKDGGEK